jgi:hypothetical protein
MPRRRAATQTPLRRERSRESNYNIEFQNERRMNRNELTEKIIEAKVRLGLGAFDEWLKVGLRSLG